jgi:RNA polymerase sigma-70 factor (ECF subfamily)
MKTLFNQVYAENYSKILNFIKNKINGDLETAEELTNDVFLKVNEHLSIFNPDLATISTWIHTIAKNIVINHYRKQKEQLISIDNVHSDNDGKKHYITISSDDNTSDKIESRELSLAIDTAMNKLTGKYKEVAKLYFLHNKKYVEIADILDIPLNSVGTTLLRAKEALQWQLRNVHKSVLA